MGAKPLQASRIYQQLLNSVKKHVGNDETKRHFIDFVREEFRSDRGLSDQSSIQNKLKLARDYTFMINSIQHHKELLFSYNIAVERSEEMKRVLNKSAASVGLQLPEVYQS